jgi:pimeloyl-ACP methyl ester carboxylesterase
MFQVPFLAHAGFRAIAPDLRGYGGSDKPDGIKSYAFKNILQDIVGILEQLNVDR